MRDTSLQGRIHGVSAFCMIPACNTINHSKLSVLDDDNKCESLIHIKSAWHNLCFK
jgi:hypothetical protein